MAWKSRIPRIQLEQASSQGHGNAPGWRRHGDIDAVTLQSSQKLAFHVVCLWQIGLREFVRLFPFNCFHLLHLVMATSLISDLFVKYLVAP